MTDKECVCWKKNTFIDHAATEHDVKHWHRKKKKKKVSAGLTHPAHQLSAMRTILIAEKKHLPAGMLSDIEECPAVEKTQLYNVLVDSWKSNKQNGKKKMTRVTDT